MDDVIENSTIEILTSTLAKSMAAQKDELLLASVPSKHAGLSIEEKASHMHSNIYPDKTEVVTVDGIPVLKFYPYEFENKNNIVTVIQRYQLF